MSALLWNLPVHFRVHNSPQLDPILSHINPVRTLKHYFSEILRSESSVMRRHGQTEGYPRSETGMCVPTARCHIPEVCKS